jgi:drug/metabolite transporter (DMT)-like permease
MPDRKPHAFNPLLILAFAAIYILWGTTFLAIRIAVQEVAPLFAAGTRFFVAGLLLYAFMRAKGTARPTWPQWRGLSLLAVLMFVGDYGPLFWAEKYVASGIASILAGTIPLITIALEMFVFRRLRFEWRLLAATLLGFAGVAILLWPARDQSVALVPCLAILAGSTAWCVGGVLNRSFKLPESKPLTSGASMMIGGAALLLLSGAFGELHPFPHISLRAGVALLYLIVFGSIVAFTAYVWLLARMPATRVASYAYVNPIVAVALGYFAAAEPITLRMLCGAAIVLISVYLTLRKPAQPA